MKARCSSVSGTSGQVSDRSLPCHSSFRRLSAAAAAALFDQVTGDTVPARLIAGDQSSSRRALKQSHPDGGTTALDAARDLFGDSRPAQIAGCAVNRLNSPVDRDEWYLNPQTVNASYNANLNEMTFPAGILASQEFARDDPVRISQRLGEARHPVLFCPDS
jgi:hypothetical protein